MWYVESAPASAGSGGFEALRNFLAFAPGRGIFGDRLMIVPKDARALLHYRRCARPRHLRILRRERAAVQGGLQAGVKELRHSNAFR